MRSQRKKPPFKLATLPIALAMLLGGCVTTAQPQPTAGARGPSFADRVVVVDAGHPSENGHGATSPRGTLESQITLAVAKKLETLLKESGITVVMTRTEQNQVVTNRDRAEIANRAGAVALIRLHCDSRAASGTATYYPDRQGTVGGITGPSNDVIARSERLARIFHSRLIIAMGPGWGDVGVLGDSQTAVGAQQGALTGSIFSRVPAITVEMVSLANARDDAFITTEDGQMRMARALAAGIEAYLSSPQSGLN